MDFKKKIIIALFILFCMGTILAPVSYATDGGAGWKRSIMNQVAKGIAQATLRNLQNLVLAKIRNGGPGGKPLFVQNWVHFILQSQYTGENIFRAELSTAKLCDYLADDIKKIFGVDPKIKTPLGGQDTRTDSLQTFELATTCTLPTGFTPQKYQQDFAGNGGWDAFARLLEPQNNAWGLVALSQNEIQKQRALAEKSNVNEALSGKGFIGSRDGKCKVQGPAGTCLVSGDILTPGSIFDQTTAGVLNAPIQFLANADDGSVGFIGIFVGMMVDRLFNLAGSQDDTQITKITTENSYKEEFCGSKKVSSEAASFIAKNFPQAFKDFPVGGGGPLGPLPGPGPLFSNGGSSACERVRSDDNTFPYSRCVQACSKAVGLIPDNVSVPSSPPIPPDDGEDSCPNLPATEPEPASLKAQVQTEIDKYTLPTTPEQQGVIMNTVAWNNKDSGWVLLGKVGGNKCPSPSGATVSCDYLVHQPTMYGYDVFSSEGSVEMKAAWIGPDNGIECRVSKGSRSLVPPVQP